MEEIEMEKYQIELKKQIEKRLPLIKERNHFKKKGKLAKYLVQKGHEPDLVWIELNYLSDK